MIAFLWVIIFLVSLFVLAKSSDYFTESAEKIGLYFGMPAFIIGITIISIGTSLPELLTSIIAVFQGHSEIVIGDVLGSNITNILLGLGLVGLIGRKVKIKSKLVSNDLPFLVGTALLLLVALWDRVFSLTEAILFLVLFVVYILYASKISREDKKTKEQLEKIQRQGPHELKNKLNFKTWIILLISAVFLYLGAHYVVQSVINLSDIFGIGKEIIAASAVAIGTSLPEIATAITLVKKSKYDMSIGTLLGSNIFNVLAVMGIPALFGILIVTDTIMSFILPAFIIASLLAFFIIQDDELTIWEGLLLLMFYVFFIGKLFGWF